MKLKAVCNSTPIIILSQIDRLGFLELFDELIVPKAVYDEIQLGDVPEKMGEIDYKIKTCEKIESEFDVLDEGEARGLSIVKDMGGDHIFLSDDLQARQIAKEEGIEVHGSVGIIVLAFSKNKVDMEEAKRLIRDIQKETDLFITDKVVELGIQELKKAFQ